MNIGAFFSSLFGGASSPQKSTLTPNRGKTQHPQTDRHRADSFLLDLAIRHQVRLDLDLSTTNGSKCLPGVLPLKREGGQLLIQRGKATTALQENAVAIVLLAPPGDLAKSPVGTGELLQELTSCPFPNLRAQALYTMESIDSNRAIDMAVTMASDSSPEVRVGVAKVIRRSLKLKKRTVSGVAYQFIDPPPSREILTLLDQLRHDNDSRVATEAAESLHAISNSMNQMAAHETALNEKSSSKSRSASKD